jgi:hypothetical protein
MFIKKVISTLLILTILISCKFNTEEFNKSNNRILDSNIKEFKFPDSVYVNESYHGYLKYNLSLDTINSNDIDERFTFFYLTNEKEVFSLEEIKKLNYNIFVDTTDRGNFHFKILFDKNASNIISGVIEDKIFLKQTDEDGSVIIKTKETIIAKDIRVVKRPLSQKK